MSDLAHRDVAGVVAVCSEVGGTSIALEAIGVGHLAWDVSRSTQAEGDLIRVELAELLGMEASPEPRVDRRVAVLECASGTYALVLGNETALRRFDVSVSRAVPAFLSGFATRSGWMQLLEEDGNFWVLINPSRLLDTVLDKSFELGGHHE